jgi:hyperosmotically inducible protein
MSFVKCLMAAALVGVVFAGPACTEKAVDETKQATVTALDTTKERAATVIDEIKNAGEETAEVTKNLLQKTGETTKEIAGKTADNTKEIVGEIADKSKDVASATGEAITDGWITTKVSAKFADETLLKGSNINVDTNSHVVTLKGTVGSDAAKARAAAIARGTEGVTRLVNQLVVRET